MFLNIQTVLSFQLLSWTDSQLLEVRIMKYATLLPE